MHADLVEAIERRPVVGPRRFQHVQHVLGVAHVGEIGLGDDQNVVRADQRALGPRRPLMGDVEHDAGGRHAHRIEDRIERIGAEIIDLVQCCGRCQQVEAVGALRQQTLHEGSIRPFLLEDCIGNALDRILVVIEAGGAEGKIEIDHDGIEREIARDRPGHVVRDGGGTDATLGADHGDDAADGHGLGGRVETADCTHDVDRLDRSGHVVADAAPHQFTIGRDVVGAADHDDAGTGVADGREFIERFENVGAGLGLQQNDVRRRCRVVGIDGGGNAAHVNRKEGLAETTVFARRAHRGGDRDAGAIGLYRYAWRRRDIFVGLRRCVVQLIV